MAQEVLRVPGADIEVILPFGKDEYLATFGSDEGRREFEALFARARRPSVLRDQRPDQESGDGGDAQEREAAIKQAYENVGRAVVAECDILVALWDGEPARGRGGTAEIVEYARRREKPLVIISTKTFVPAAERCENFDLRALEKIHEFNTRTMREPDEQTYIKNMFDHLFDNPEGRGLPDAVKNMVRERLLPFYVHTSKIAKANQKVYMAVGTLVYAFSVAAIAAIATGVLDDSQRLLPWAFFAEFLLLAAILGVILVANRKEVQRKWIENRFLAERIRSAIFLACAGIEVSPIAVPPYMRMAHRPNDWMVRVFNEIWNRLPPLKHFHQTRREVVMPFLQERWIAEQMRFHRAKSSRRFPMSKRLEFAGVSVFSVAIIAALVHCFFCIGHQDGLLPVTDDILIFLAIVLPGAGAAIAGIRTLREYSRVEKRSENMALVLQDTLERFKTAGSDHECEVLLRQTEKLMLRETQDWLMLMRFAELKPPA